MLFLATLFIGWYVPCIIALCDKSFVMTSCYRLMTAISFVCFVVLETFWGLGIGFIWARLILPTISLLLADGRLRAVF
jgi:hypothetical protein